MRPKVHFGPLDIKFNFLSNNDDNIILPYDHENTKGVNANEKSIILYAIKSWEWHVNLVKNSIHARKFIEGKRMSDGGVNMKLSKNLWFLFYRTYRTRVRR